MILAVREVGGVTNYLSSAVSFCFFSCILSFLFLSSFFLIPFFLPLLVQQVLVSHLFPLFSNLSLPSPLYSTPSLSLPGSRSFISFPFSLILPFLLLFTPSLSLPGSRSLNYFSFLPYFSALSSAVPCRIPTRFPLLYLFLFPSLLFALSISDICRTILLPLHLILCFSPVLFSHHSPPLPPPGPSPCFQSLFLNYFLFFLSCLPPRISF